MEKNKEQRLKKAKEKAEKEGKKVKILEEVTGEPVAIVKTKA